MAADPQTLYARALAVADNEGRLPLSRMTLWEVFPFDPDGLNVVPLEAPSVPEPPRHGVGGVDCFGCGADMPAIWEDERWRLISMDGSGVPLFLMLSPKIHHDLADLPDDLAAEMGVLIVRIARAVESLPNIARAHVSKWGDGGEHLHVFFYARPEGFSQMRGTMLAVWDDLLPETPADERSTDARAVADALTAAGPLR